MYTAFTNLPLDEAVNIPAKPPKQSQVLQSTSSFDALRRLSNHDDCIQDALSTRGKLASQINSLLEKQKEPSHTINAAFEAEQSLAATDHFLTTSRKLLKAAESRRTELQVSLDARCAAIASGKLAQQKA